MADYSMANRKIAYTLGRGRAYIFDMSSTSGNMGAKYVQAFGPIFNDLLKTKKDAQHPYDHFGGCIKPYRAIWTHFRPNSMTFINLILQTSSP